MNIKDISAFCEMQNIKFEYKIYKNHYNTDIHEIIAHLPDNPLRMGWVGVEEEIHCNEFYKQLQDRLAQ